MKIFVDTAKLDEIKEACSWGIVDGVTTNPSLIKRAVDEVKGRGKGIDMETYIWKICKTAGKGRPVSLEVISLTMKEMVEEAELLYRKFNPAAENVVIKIPINTNSDESEEIDYDALKTIKKLSRKGIPINVTLIMTPEQALLAAKAGASYASPFAGRIDDYIRKKLGIEFGKVDYFDFDLIEKIGRQRLDKHLKNSGGEPVASIYLNKETKNSTGFGQDNGIGSGVNLVKSIMKIYRNYEIPTEVIAASIRNTRQIRQMAEAGAHIATIPFPVIRGMLQHHKTVEGIKSFSADVVPEYRDLFQS
jgi:transaldolase